MSRISGSILRFCCDARGAVTIDWVAMTAAFVVLGIGITYAIFGDEDGGLIAIVNGKQEQLSENVSNVDQMLSEVDSWSPGGS